jgi:hypothetical protein
LIEHIECLDTGDESRIVSKRKRSTDGGIHGPYTFGASGIPADAGAIRQIPVSVAIRGGVDRGLTGLKLCSLPVRASNPLHVRKPVRRCLASKFADARSLFDSLLSSGSAKKLRASNMSETSSMAWDHVQLERN